MVWTAVWFLSSQCTPRGKPIYQNMLLVISHRTPTKYGIKISQYVKQREVIFRPPALLLKCVGCGNFPLPQDENSGTQTVL